VVVVVFVSVSLVVEIVAAVVTVVTVVTVGENGDRGADGADDVEDVDDVDTDVVLDCDDADDGDIDPAVLKELLEEVEGDTTRKEEGIEEALNRLLATGGAVEGGEGRRGVTVVGVLTVMTNDGLLAVVAVSILLLFVLCILSLVLVLVLVLALVSCALVFEVTILELALALVSKFRILDRRGLYARSPRGAGGPVEWGICMCY
jgi:hypothetical protein